MCKEKFVYRFLYQLSLLEGRPAKNAIAYKGCGCSILGGEYKRVIATAVFGG